MPIDATTHARVTRVIFLVRRRARAVQKCLTITGTVAGVALLLALQILELLLLGAGRVNRAVSGLYGQDLGC